MQLFNRQILFAFCCITAFSTVAGEQEQGIIERTIHAYGGKQLLALKTIKIEDEYKGFRYGQSNSPDEVDMVDYRSSLTIDLENKRKDFKWLRGNQADFSTQHRIFNGRTGYVINHDKQTLTQDNHINYRNAGRNHSYYLDTAMVLLLNENKNKVKYLGQKMLHGKAHNLLELNTQGFKNLTFYLEKETGKLSLMTRPHWRPNTFFNYNYSDYQQQQGITYAASTYVTRGGQPFNAFVKRQVDFNPTITNEFIVPQDYGKAPDILDFSEMTISSPGDNLYLVGKDWGFTLFIDAGDYFIAAGGYQDLSKRFALMKEKTGLDKPLKYQVVSHHHLDHLGGMSEAAALGASFITVQSNVASIQQVLDQPLPDQRFIIIKEQASFANGLVQIIDYPNSHANHSLLTYIPEAKLLFSADLYLSRQKTGAPDGSPELAQLKNTLAKHKLKVEHFAAAHSSRVLTNKDFNASLNNMPTAVCPANWQICFD
ncbi:hypothetical protein tinsulaeT_19190 [Thalassotalea insulae]|uniref:Metallo-beta-lactamase domain-containing protein n=1 Tax=Thalassotalea insulae TaxID=2056778 RepID=A0ABQ6GTT8_9GAMM|nr:hypothetical protein [Thalassotalea insulae]GLX78579.1 hypothetical protein tinsulaeT_19190 [Thalassotalea insulae]